MLMTIGEKIAVLRKKKGYSQEKMAELLEMTPNGYGKIERNETDLPYSRLELISKVLGLLPHKLLGFGEEQINVTNGNVNYGDNNNAIFQNLTDKELHHEIEKMKLRVEFLEKENANQQKIISLLEKK
jgi:transcriptional regulator with XRE-family HTH domain